MSNKPSWLTAPEDAKVLIQNCNGSWMFGTFPRAKPTECGWQGTNEQGEASSRYGHWKEETRVLDTPDPNWKDSIEYRPNETHLQDYRNLIARVRHISRDAAHYLRHEAHKLRSFMYRGRLASAFVWDTTPQGRDYWNNLRKRLTAVPETADSSWHDGTAPAEAVARGVAWLDQHLPGWAAKARGAVCNSLDNDILCRVTGAECFPEAKDKALMSDQDARYMGFDSFTTDTGEYFGNRVLQPYWDAAIAERATNQEQEKIVPQANHPFIINKDGSVEYEGDTFDREQVTRLIAEIKAQLNQEPEFLGEYNGYSARLRERSYRHLQIGCQAFNMEYIKAFIVDYENQPASKVLQVRLGDRLIRNQKDGYEDDQEYIVARLSYNSVQLISLSDGNRWNEPVTDINLLGPIPLNKLVSEEHIHEFSIKEE